jgi:4-carboxymuconolactone decarboxylase
MMFMQRGLSLPRELVHALSIRVSRNNRCSFCFDAHQAAFLLDGANAAGLTAATRPLDDPSLDPQLRAVLAYADEVVGHGEVSDATFGELAARFNERQIVEVVWVAAVVTYLNMMARSLRLQSDGLCALVEAKQRAA